MEMLLEGFVPLEVSNFSNISQLEEAKVVTRLL